MSNHEVKVIRVENVRKHPNADSLDIIQIWGYQCIVKQNQFPVGSLAAYVESDYTVKLSRDEFKFLDKGKGKERHRVTVIKLRGEWSYGLLIPAPEGSKEGDNVMDLLQVERYEPPQRGGSFGPTGFLSGLCESGPEFHTPHYDLENIRKYNDVIQDGEEVIYSEKIHGTSAKYVFSNNKFYCGSRTTWKKKPGILIKTVEITNKETGEVTQKDIFSPENAWHKAAEQNPWIEEWCRAHPDTVLYGEVYGCFQYKTPIKLGDGSQKMIGEIVNSQMPLSVKTINTDSGLLEERKIVGFHKQPATIDEWIQLTYKRKHWGGRATGLIVTKNHKIFTKNFTEVDANELQIGDTVLLYSPKTLNFVQEQFILGSLLGDGYVDENYRFSVSHSVKQKDYLATKRQIFNTINTEEFTKISGHGSEMVGFQTSSLHNKSAIEFRSLCYPNGKKQVTKIWLEKLTPLALAFWYCDDGSITKITGKNDQCSIATMCFTEKEMAEIVDHFAAMQIDCYPIDSGHGPVLRFSPEGTKKFHILIAPYVIPSMRYKLTESVHNIPCILDSVTNVANQWSKNYIETTILTKRNVTPDEFDSKHLNYKYDLTIEGNHNYFANKILVHNSNVQGKFFHYGKKDGEYRFSVFDILKEGKWVDNKELFDNPEYRDTLGETVKVVYRGPHNKELLFKMIEESSVYPGQPLREGIVVKPLEEKHHPRIGRVALKAVSNKYLMKEIPE